MHRSLKCLGVFLLALFSLSSGRSLHAQGGATGAISGQVVDSSGSSIADAEVQIVNTATQALVRKIPTTADATFVAALLPPADYSVIVNKTGLAEAKVARIEVRV